MASRCLRDAEFDAVACEEGLKGRVFGAIDPGCNLCGEVEAGCGSEVVRDRSFVEGRARLAEALPVEREEVVEALAAACCRADGEVEGERDHRPFEVVADGPVVDVLVGPVEAGPGVEAGQRHALFEAAGDGEVALQILLEKLEPVRGGEALCA